MMRFARIASVTAFALFFAVACGGAEEDTAPTTVEATPAPAAPAEAPAAEPAAATPAEPATADAAQGEQLYATYCGSCHGARGAGDGPVAAGLDPKPAKHTDGAYMNALSNEHLFKVIQKGGPAVGKSPMMAPWGGTLSDAQIWDVIAFVRSLAEPPYEGAVP